jgi:hypothetical protein
LPLDVFQRRCEDASMHFGIKTTWLAVRDRTGREVAEALKLAGVQDMAWDEGVDRAYEHGVFVTPAVRGWTLAHGRLDLLPLPYGPVDPDFLPWIAALSKQLGTVQLFANERGWSHHAWVSAVNGEVVRAFAISDGAIPLFLGAVTPAERELGRGVRTYTTADLEVWDEADWDAWYAQTPSEFDVLRLAGRWSVDPTKIEVSGIRTPGLYGTRVKD